MNISQQQYASLQSMGYSLSQISQAMREIEKEDSQSSLRARYEAAKSQQIAYSNTPRVNSPFATPEIDNMNKWQLDVDGTLERLYHLFRSDILVIENGHKVWKENPEEKKRKLNDTGANDCMELLSSYLNKETFLGNYSEEQIMNIVYDISLAFRDLLYMNYERYGWVDEDEITGGQKRTYYRTLTLQVSNIILGSYMRAWKGEERKSLRENRQVNQVENLSSIPGININQPSQLRERGVVNPLRYIKGKYY